MSCYWRRESFEHHITIYDCLKCNQSRPFLSLRIGNIVQKDYAQMVDMVKDILFLHAAADYVDIKPLLELTSLAVLIGYMWVSVL